MLTLVISPLFPSKTQRGFFLNPCGQQTRGFLRRFTCRRIWLSTADSDRPCDQALSLFFFVCLFLFLGWKVHAKGFLGDCCFVLFRQTFIFVLLNTSWSCNRSPTPCKKGPQRGVYLKACWLRYTRMQRNRRAWEGRGWGTEYKSPSVAVALWIC